MDYFYISHSGLRIWLQCLNTIATAIMPYSWSLSMKSRGSQPKADLSNSLDHGMGRIWTNLPNATDLADVRVLGTPEHVHWSTWCNLWASWSSYYLNTLACFFGSFFFTIILFIFWIIGRYRQLNVRFLGNRHFELKWWRYNMLKEVGEYSMVKDTLLARGIRY